MKQYVQLCFALPFLISLVPPTPANALAAAICAEKDRGNARRRFARPSSFSP